MDESIREVVTAIDSLATVDEEDELILLEELVDRYFAEPQARTQLAVWFRLYERFPESDGYGIFWTILHGIEDQPGYEPLVVESVRRRASRFPTTMVNRLLNGGIQSAGGADLCELLAAIAADEQILSSVREDARRFLEHQQRRDAFCPTAQESGVV